MRQLSTYAQNSSKVKSLLDMLSDLNTGIEDYASAFYQLGGALSNIIRDTQKLSSQSTITLACSSEDADLLSKGILDDLEQHTAKINLAVFWNTRADAFENKDYPVAPIIKKYIESLDDVDILIICKSIINTSCVVKTNLTYLIERINPQKIIIASPVLFEQAIPNLKNEFAQPISSKFEFLYFAKDTEVNSLGEVIPGIGGSVYQRLGLENTQQKNKYIPGIVKTRRANHHTSC
ncbi:hypothetical protein [Chitinophaga sp.]|uniref:hypothetical protein n=1 Tax=Chitinophaga sp. TaxID=1869181 RepID=UPI0031E3B38E